MDYRFKTKPFQHQLDALEQSWNKEVWALFMEMGTGKTKVCIDNIAILYDKGKINAALIVVPNGIKRNWRNELGIHLADHINYRVGIWSASPKKKEKDDLLELVPIKFSKDLVTGICVWGDPHLDDGGANWDVLTSLIETLKKYDPDRGSEDPIYSVNIGDSHNNWISRLSRYYIEQKLTKSMVYKVIEYLIEEINFILLISFKKLNTNVSEVFKRTGFVSINIL